MKVKIGVSARHVHLCREDLDFLFGNNYELNLLKDLYQAGEYACKETLTIKTEKGSYNNVRILGPVREYTQIEISKTDAYILGLNPPVRNSGDISESAAITLVNGDKEIFKKEGCIIATRHLHVSNDEALQYGLTDGEVVSFILNGEKGGTINNVHIKTDAHFRLELHIDLDDANAHLAKTGDEGELIINE